ncbi:MAG: hypothetical protein U9O65_10360 [Thermotogota bacterium]|nr:hypothetical protein [Thermotogota bacterium]
MNTKKDSILLPKDTVITLAIETWRLWQMMKRVKNKANSVGLRYSVRKMKDALEAQGCSFIDITGQRYDEGMAVDIIDIEGENKDNAVKLVKEMMAPIILFKNELLIYGQVILERKIVSIDTTKEGKR